MRIRTGVLLSPYWPIKTYFPNRVLWFFMSEHNQSALSKFFYDTPAAPDCHIQKQLFKPR